jgi:hypothetical protein
VRKAVTKIIEILISNDARNLSGEIHHITIPRKNIIPRETWFLRFMRPERRSRDRVDRKIIRAGAIHYKIALASTALVEGNEKVMYHVSITDSKIHHASSVARPVILVCDRVGRVGSDE